MLIYGGKSGEHEISLVSASAIARNVDARHAIFLVGITKSGRWFLQEDSELFRIRADQTAHFEISEKAENEMFVIPGGGKTGAFCTRSGKKIATDVVFPVLHGTNGEDGTVQGLFEIALVPYVGCSVGASAWTMDKEKTKSLLAHAGIPVVPGVCVRKSDFLSKEKLYSIIKSAEDDFGYPMFVKPCSAGSSNGAQKTFNRTELDSALLGAFEWDCKVLVEKAIDAREIECSVTGNPTTADGTSAAETLCAYVPGEIAPSHGFYDYDAKYNDPKGASLLIPANLPEKRLSEVLALAKKAYAALDLSGLSRVDFFIDRKTETLFLNEINTLPGFTQISMFPKMCESAGLSFTNLIERLLEEAILRAESAQKLRTSR